VAHWALINLLLAIAGVILAVIGIVRYIRRKNKKEEYVYDTDGVHDEAYGTEESIEDAELKIRRYRARTGWLALSVVIAIVAVIAFILTEDTDNIMVLIDAWTLLMAVLFVGVAVSHKLTFKTDEKPADDEEQPYGAPDNTAPFLASPGTAEPSFAGAGNAGPSYADPGNAGPSYASSETGNPAAGRFGWTPPGKGD
jgi:hypothetical protein